MTEIGIDMGRAEVKFSSAAGVGSFSSYNARGIAKRILPADGNGSPSIAVKVDGIDWILGADAIMGTNFVWQTDENKVSERSKLIIPAVLGPLGITDADIVIGLPVSLADNEKVCKKAKQLFSGECQATVNGRDMAFRVSARVVAEPVGTYLSLVLDEHARPLTSSPFYRDQMTVVDIGFSTVDIITIRSGVLAAAKASTLSGTVTLFEKSWKLLEQNHGMLKANEHVKVYETITKNFGAANLRINGEYVSPGFWNEIAKLKQQLARDIVDDVRGVIGNSRPDHIVVTGGGALFLREELLATEKSLTIHPNPRYANSIGFYRAALAGARG